MRPAAEAVVRGVPAALEGPEVPRVVLGQEAGHAWPNQEEEEEEKKFNII